MFFNTSFLAFSSSCLTRRKHGDGDNATYDAGLVKFFANNGASDPANGVGGELVAGEQMTGRFTVQIQ